MKRLLIGATGSVFVLIAAVFVGLFLTDWNSQHARLAAVVQEAVRDATGRPVTIEGDVELSLLPSPAVSAKSVSLWDGPREIGPGSRGSSGATAELDELRLTVAFWPLFRGRIEVESMVLVRPTLRLETRADGTGNWDAFLATAEAGRADEGWLAERLHFDRYAVVGGTLIYRGLGAGREQRVERITGTVAADPSGGGLAIEGTAALRGLNTTFQAKLGGFDRSGAASLEATFELPRAQAKGAFDGTLTRRDGAFALHGGLTGSGKELAALIAAVDLGGEPGRPAVPADRFSITAELASTAAGLALSELDLKVGETSLSGAVTARWGTSLYLEAELAADKLDLDRLRAEAGADPQEPFGQGLLAEVSGWALPRGFEADVDLRVEHLVYRGSPARQLHLVARLEAGQATLHKAAAILPGETEIALSGSLIEGLLGPSFSGFVNGVSTQPRATLSWAGIEIPEITAEGLGEIQLSSEIAVTNGRLDLRDLDLKVGGSQVQGALVVALKARPALGLGLLIDRIDLGGEASSPDRGAALWARLTALQGEFDANLDLRIGTLVHSDLTIEDLHLVGKLQGDLLTLEEASGKDLAGNFVRYAGKLTGLGGSPALAGAITLRAAAPARLASLLNLEPGALEAIGPFKLSGDLDADSNAIAFKLEVAALGGRFDLDGSIPSLAAPMDFALTLNARHKDLAKLINRLAAAQLVGPGLGGLAAKARLKGSARQIAVSQLTGTVGPARVEGGLIVDLSGKRPVARAIDLGVVARHGNLARLLAALSPSSPVTPAFGSVDLAGRVSGKQGELRLSDLAGRVGPIEMSGALTLDLAGPALGASDVALDLAIEHPNLAELAAALGLAAGVGPEFGGVVLHGRAVGGLEQLEVRDLRGKVGPGELRGSLVADLSGAKPKFSLDLTTGPLPVAVLLGALVGTEGGTEGGTEDGADGVANAEAGAETNSTDDRWSSTAIDLAGLRRFDGDLRVRSNAWLYRDYRLDDANLRASLRNGVLELRKLSGTIYGGAVQVVGKVKAGGRLDVGLTVDAVDLELAQLLRPHTTFERLSGPVTLKASLITEGASEAELIAGLTGRGTLSGSLNLESEAQEAASATLLALLGGQGEGAAQGGSIDAGQTLLNAFAGEPAVLEGNFAVNRGVIRTGNARIDGRGAYALARGRADLADWRLDTRVDVYRLDNVEESYLTVDLDGPLDDPGSRFRSQRADALLSSGQGSLIERVREFRGMLGEVIDFEPMARYVLGPHTETITPAQWSRFLKQYETLFLEGYEFSAGGSWTGAWNVQDIRPYGDDLLITVAFQDRSGGSSKVGFRVREKANALFGFKIVDAISQGISLLVTQKSEFSSILKKQGVDGLTRVLEREFSETEPKVELPGVQDREALRVVPHNTNR